MSTQAIPFVLFCGFLFGSSLIASRFALYEFDPTAFTGLRFVLASLAFLFVYVADRRHHPWPDARRLWRHALPLGVMGTALPILGTVMALQYLSSGIAALFLTVGPAVTVLLAHFVLRDERLSMRKALGVSLALAGAMSLALRGENGLAGIEQANPAGYGLMAGALLCISLSTIYVRKFMGIFRTMDVASSQMFVATLVTVPAAVWLAGPSVGHVSWRGSAALLYGSLAGTFLGILVYNHNIRRFGATAASMTQYIVPIVAAAGGILFLGEEFTGGMAVAVAVIGLGISLLRL